LDRSDTVGAFLDGAEFQGQQAALARLYQATFDRTPDACGFAYWVQQAQHGMSLENIAANFLASPEWANLAIVDDAAFVAHLYQSVLNRTADAEGQAYWETQLTNGSSRASVLIGFTESTENRVALDQEVTLDILYLGLLGRTGDASGYAYWLNELESGNLNEDQVIDSFLTSSEFHDRVLPANAAMALTLSGVNPQGTDAFFL